MIEVFADIWCPFTHFGLRSVSEALSARDRNDIPIWVRSWPLEWVNGRAMEVNLALEHARELQAQVTPLLFESFDGSHFPRSTIAALALVAQGYAIDPAVGLALSLKIREDLFERNQDISDPDLLSALARPFALRDPSPDDYAAVVSDWREGRSRGVLGSPHFFCSGRDLFCPSLDITKDSNGEGVTIGANLTRLERFLDACLS